MKSSMRAQAAEPLAKLASINRQIEQKLAESQSITATIAKIDASLPLVEEGATIRRKAMEIQYGNHIAYLDAQTKLVEQQNERIVQQRKIVEVAAARQALEQQIEATFRENIRDPKAKVPGTKMIYGGLKDEQKANDLVAFLKQFDADGKKK